jgi:hypothetical protein
MPDPYKNQLLDQKRPVTDKTVAKGRVVAVLNAHAEHRQLQLEPFPSRAVLKNEIHELILTLEDAHPNSVVDGISYVCFFEVLESAILWQDDVLLINAKKIGKLAGYDNSHMPNHMNIIVRSDIELLTGFDLDLKPEDPIEFRFVKNIPQTRGDNEPDCQD